MFFYLDPKQVRKLVAAYKPTARKMATLSVFLHQQVKTRFATGGQSGGKAWAGKWLKAVGADDGRAILTGPTGHLLMSFMGLSGVSGGKAWAEVASDSVAAYTHQVGTRGKGGLMADIRAKKAKALFIPLTDKAAKSDRLAGPEATMFRQSNKLGESPAPLRVAVKWIKNKAKKIPDILYSTLTKGRIKDGKLQKWSPKLEKYVEGKPDFIFLKRVSITARPMLPDSPAEKKAQDDFIVELLAG